MWPVARTQGNLCGRVRRPCMIHSIADFGPGIQLKIKTKNTNNPILNHNSLHSENILSVFVIVKKAYIEKFLECISVQ